jgi:hypothetical protein
VAGDLLTELRDREALRQLKARYFETLDLHDWDGFRSLLADDGRFELVEQSAWPLLQSRPEPFEGADAFVAATAAVLDPARTVHHGHTSELVVTSPTEAHGTWVLRDYVEWAPDPESGRRRGMKGYGIYEEPYRKVDGAWRIAGWRLRYLRLDPLPREPLPGPAIGGPEDAEHVARARAAYAARPPEAPPVGEPDLLDILAIKHLKARSLWAADTGDWDGLRATLAEDVVADLPGARLEGASAYVDAVRAAGAQARTVRHGHMPQITIDGPRTAHGTWTVATYVERPSDGRRQGSKAYGFDRETYIKDGGAWRIAGVHESRLRVDALPAAPLPDRDPLRR